MIRVDRSKIGEPAGLSARDLDGWSELERVRQSRANGKSFDFKVYKKEDVKAALEALFHGKCAYCESFFAKTQPVDVEHYRPKNQVEGEVNHPGYWWLAMDWENLLPSCIDCNRRRGQSTPIGDADSMVKLVDDRKFSRSKKISTGKQSAFPLKAGSPRALDENPPETLAKEERLLLDPTRDEPDEHLAFHIDRKHLVSLVYPKPDVPDHPLSLPRTVKDTSQLVKSAFESGASAVGAVSIQVYGLNRLGLVQARTRVLRELEFLLELMKANEEVLAEVRERKLQTGDEQEKKFLDRITKKLKLQSDMLKERIRQSTEPAAPFSALAKAWVRAVLESGE